MKEKKERKEHWWNTKEPIREQSVNRVENERQLMKFNKWLGSKKVRFRFCIGISVFLFLVLNFFLNVFGRFFTTELFTIKIWYIFVPYTGSYAAICYLLLLFAAAAVGGYEYYKITISFREENIGQKGTRRFTLKEEIIQQYKAVPDRDQSFPGLGGIPVSRIDKTIYVDDSVTNAIVLGMTRSGKGEMFVLPIIDTYSRGSVKPSMVITDMKKELFPMSYQTLLDRGYLPLLFDLDDPTHGIQFNPLTSVIILYRQGDIAGAELIAQSYAYSVFMQEGNSDANADFFLDNATAALTAAILAHIDDCMREDRRLNILHYNQWLKAQDLFCDLSEEEQKKIRARYQGFLEYQRLQEDPEPMTAEDILGAFPELPLEVEFIPYDKNTKCITMDSITHTFLDLGRQKISQNMTQLDVYFNRRDEFDRAKALYASIEVSGDRTKGSIFSQALSKMSLYNFEDISRLTAESTFDLTDLGFGEKPIALFISVPLEDRSKDAIVSTLYSQIFQMNTKKAAKQPDKKCKRLIVNLWDEIGNFPPVRNLNTMVSIGLGINIMYLLILQSYNQLDEKYGASANTIKDNCGNHVYIQTISLETAEHFSKLVGTQTITNITRSGRKLDTNKTITEMYEDRTLLRADELMGLQEEECVIVRAMKRRDLAGNPIVPYPIFNSRASGTNFLYRYKYLQDTFPSDVDLRDCHVPEIELFDTRERNYRTEIIFEEFEYSNVKKILDDLEEGRISLAEAFGDDEEATARYAYAQHTKKELEKKYFCNLSLRKAYPLEWREILKELRHSFPGICIGRRPINEHDSLSTILENVCRKTSDSKEIRQWMDRLLQREGTDPTVQAEEIVPGIDTGESDYLAQFGELQDFAYADYAEGDETE